MSVAIQRRAVMRLTLAGVLALPARAFADPPLGAPLPEPGLPIAALNDGLLEVMRAGKSTPFVQRYQMLAPTVDRAFDLNEILRLSVGLSWSSLPANEQAQLAAMFRLYTVATYVANFDSFTGQSFAVSPNLRPVGNGEQIVATKIVPGDGSSPVEVDFVMRQVGGGWKAVDVLLDGSISRVAVQRSDFRSLLAGGSAQPLIASLRQKVSQLSAGTLS
jgi:phospholipid transport system substrate-binding protein